MAKSVLRQLSLSLFSFFINDPQSVVKGAAMPKQGLTDDELDEILKTLAANKN